MLLLASSTVHTIRVYISVCMKHEIDQQHVVVCMDPFASGANLVLKVTIIRNLFN